MFCFITSSKSSFSFHDSICEKEEGEEEKKEKGDRSKEREREEEEEEKEEEEEDNRIMYIRRAIEEVTKMDSPITFLSTGFIGYFRYRICHNLYLFNIQTIH